MSDVPANDPAANKTFWSNIRPAERTPVFWATVWFFFILLSYLIVRPVRETFGSIGGTKQLQGLMFATFAAMLVAVPVYSWLVARLPRRWLVRCVYHFFAGSLVLFFVFMRSESSSLQAWTARAFFVWVNVFALFATSVFWSVLADLFSSEQGKRLFGVIAAGGTLGAITGSILTTQLATRVSTGTLLVVPAVMIEIGLVFAWRLEKSLQAKQAIQSSSDRPAGGGLLAGITHVFRSSYLVSICAFLICVQAAGTQLYFQQAEIVNASLETKEARTQLFASIDLGTQLLTLALQSLVASVVLRRLGVGIALFLLPLVYLVSFASLAIHPTLATLVVVMVATRASAYGITVPSREVLFTVVSREDKYKSKGFIDTVVLRGGDLVSGQLVGLLRWAQISFSTINLVALPFVVGWGILALRLGRRQQQLAAPRY